MGLRGDAESEMAAPSLPAGLPPWVRRRAWRGHLLSIRQHLEWLPVHWFDFPDHDSALERETPELPPPRRATSRLTLGLGAAVAAGAVGLLAVHGLDPTDTETTSTAEAPPSEISEEPAAHPSFGPTA